MQSKQPAASAMRRSGNGRANPVNGKNKNARVAAVSARDRDSEPEDDESIGAEDQRDEEYDSDRD